MSEKVIFVGESGAYEVDGVAVEKISNEVKYKTCRQLRHQGWFRTDRYRQRQQRLKRYGHCRRFDRCYR